MFLASLYIASFRWNSSSSVTRIQLDGFYLLRERAGINCLDFGRFRGGFILLEFQMTSFLSIVFNYLFREGASFDLIIFWKTFQLFVFLSFLSNRTRSSDITLDIFSLLYQIPFDNVLSKCGFLSQFILDVYGIFWYCCCCCYCWYICI